MPLDRALRASVLALLLAGCAAAPRPVPAPGRPLLVRGAGEAAAAEPGSLESRLAAQVSWPVVLAAVLDRNPSLEAARARWQAALEKHPSATALPDPRVRFDIYTAHSGNPDAPQRVDTMVSQAIPFPVLLARRGDLALREAEMERLRYDMALRDAVVEARDALLELAYLDRARGVVEAQREVLARMASVAAGEVAAGRAVLPEEIRARSLLAKADNDLLLLGDLRRGEAQRLRALLRLAPDAPLGPVADEGAPPLAVTLPQALGLAETRSQEIAMAGVALEMAGVETSMARWEYAPELEVGGLWMRNMEDAGGDFMGGRAATVGLTVPIWLQAKGARVREARARETAAGFERAAAVERVRVDATRLWFRVVNAERLVALYGGTLLPQAEESLRLADALHREGRGSLAGTLETAVARENLLLAWHRARADHGQALARLEQVVGAAVTEVPPVTGETAR